MTGIFLLRHCEKTAEDETAPLSAKGFAQAQALVPILAKLGITKIVSSPYLRARQSVEPIAAHSQIDIEIDAAFSEWNLSREPLADWQISLDRALCDTHYKTPTGECANDVLQRAGGAFAKLRNGSAPTLIAAHGGVLTVLLGALGRPATLDNLLKLKSPDLFHISDDGLENLSLPGIT